MRATKLIVVLAVALLSLPGLVWGGHAGQPSAGGATSRRLCRRLSRPAAGDGPRRAERDHQADGLEFWWSPRRRARPPARSPSRSRSAPPARCSIWFSRPARSGPRSPTASSAFARMTPRSPADSWRERRRERRGRHGSERVVFGRSLTIGADETVDKAVAIGGSVTVAGHVRLRCGGDRRLGHDPSGRQCRRRLGRDRRGGFGRGGRHARGRQREPRRGDPDDGRLDDPLGGRRASHVLDVQVRLAADARGAAVGHRGAHRGGLPRRLDAHRGVSRHSTRALGARRRRDPPGIRAALRPAGRDDHRHPADPGGGAASRRASSCSGSRSRPHGSARGCRSFKRRRPSRRSPWEAPSSPSWA